MKLRTISEMYRTGMKTLKAEDHGISKKDLFKKWNFHLRYKSIRMKIDW